MDCGRDITLCLPDAMLREYDPQPDRHRYEMEQCQAAEDQVGFTIAFTAYQKATRGDALLSMGEFDDEGSVKAHFSAQYQRLIHQHSDADSDQET